jgi:hypothetical protein
LVALFKNDNVDVDPNNTKRVNNMKYNIVRKVRSYSCVIKYNENWGAMEVNLHSFLTTALNYVSRFTPQTFYYRERGQDNK